MAAYGALTALQAALMAGAGGAKGLVAAREREKAEEERKQQQMDREFSTRLGIQTSGARPVTGAVPEGYEQLGSYRGVQYAAPIPKTAAQKAQDELTNLLSQTKAVANLKSELETAERAAARPALVAALAKVPKGLLSEGEREMILSAGGIKPDELIRLISDRMEAQRRGTPSTQTEAEIRKLINGEVGQLRRQLTDETIEVPDPDYTGPEPKYRVPYGKPIPTMKIKLKPEQIEAQVQAYRTSRFADYGLAAPSATPAAAPAGGTGATGGQGGGIRMSIPAPSAGQAPAPTRGAGAIDNVGAILDRTSPFGRQGAPSPMTWTSSSGKTYRF